MSMVDTISYLIIKAIVLALGLVAVCIGIVLVPFIWGFAIGNNLANALKSV